MDCDSSAMVTSLIIRVCDARGSVMLIEFEEQEISLLW